MRDYGSIIPYTPSLLNALRRVWRRDKYLKSAYWVDEWSENNHDSLFPVL